VKSVISIVRYAKSPESLEEAIERCHGFEGLGKKDRILIKPNLVFWDNQFRVAPFGVFTTTRLVEDLIILLKEYGCNDISIGEGSAETETGVGTMQAFEGLGYKEIAERYKVPLIDFNKSKPVSVTVQNGLTLKIAEEAVKYEFVIDFPVLKTHPQSKVSLALKNLKGCLKTSSKKLCHHPEFGLEYCFPFIADYVKPSLSIIDGIYALEKGAMHFGNAYRKDIIVSSRDILAADMVAARIIGFLPQDVAHFVEYARRHNRSLSLDDYEIVGEKIEDHIKPLKWDWTWTKDNTGPGIFDKLGITGIRLPKYDDTLCSGCSPLANMANILVLSAFRGEPLPKIEILNGKKMQANPGYDKTVLLGNCIIKANADNRNIEQRIKVKGCPPKHKDVIFGLKEAGLEINEKAYFDYLDQQSKKYDTMEGYSWDFYQPKDK
jgi:uncharacterized protein (DUF362 family)/Ni,Fe-hydrogenase III small subunit